jgi:hypothetical protein
MQVVKMWNGLSWLRKRFEGKHLWLHAKYMQMSPKLLQKLELCWFSITFWFCGLCSFLEINFIWKRLEGVTDQQSGHLWIIQKLYKFLHLQQACDRVRNKAPALKTKDVIIFYLNLKALLVVYMKFHKRNWNTIPPLCLDKHNSHLRWSH